MQTILDSIQSGRILLADGAMGTELQKRGLKSGQCPEALNVSDPNLIRAIHRDYYHAGADLVETNTFGGNRARLQHTGNADQAREFNRAAARLAREVCPAGKFVAGSIGPSGEILEPLGTLSNQEAESMFRDQALALAEGGVDILFVETMMSIEEAVIAVRAAKSATGLPVAASMTFQLNAGNVHTSFGVDVPTMARELQKAGADIIGTNCGHGTEVVRKVIDALRPITTLPLLVQSNAGLPELQASGLVYKEDALQMAEHLFQLGKQGLGILGGCCGTGPEHIRAFRQLVDKWNGEA